MGIPDGVPEDRCGFTLEREDIITDNIGYMLEDHWYDLIEGVCCWRPVWSNTNCCIWHADVEAKPTDVLAKSSSQLPEVLDGAILRKAEINSEVVLTGSRFLSADLSDLFTAESDLSGANFKWSTFSGAELTSTNFTNASFFETNATDTVHLRNNLTNSSFHEADMKNAVVAECNMSNADMRNTNLTESTFLESNLFGVYLRMATVESTTFMSTSLNFAYLEGLELNKVDFREASLDNLQLADAHLLDIRINDNTDFGGMCFYETNAERTVASPNSNTYTGASDTQRGHKRVVQLVEDSVFEKSSDSRSSISFLAVLKQWNRWRAIDKAKHEYVIHNMNKAIWVYRTYQRLVREQSFPDKAPKYYVREKHARRKLALAENNYLEWLKLALTRWTMLYGESPWRVVFTSLAIIATFALLYPFAGGIAVEQANPTHFVNIPFSVSLSLPAVLETGLTSLYFSLVTFTTLGYGDVQPASGAVQLLAGIESLLGAALIALLVAVLSRRVMR